LNQVNFMIGQARSIVRTSLVNTLFGCHVVRVGEADSQGHVLQDGHLARILISPLAQDTIGRIGQTSGQKRNVPERVTREWRDILNQNQPEASAQGCRMVGDRRSAIIEQGAPSSSR